MSQALDQQLAAFKPTDYTVRLCDGVSRILPAAPELVYYGSLAEAAERLGAGPAVASRAAVLAGEAGPRQVLKIASLLDRADAGLSIYTGLSSALRLCRSGERSQALRSDSQQAMDAVLKGLGLAWMVRALFEGSARERASALLALPAGQLLVSYYAAIEVGLPFADNAVTGASGLLARLFERHEADQLGRLVEVAGADQAEEASETAHALIGELEGLVQQSSQHLGSLARLASEVTSRAADITDRIASVAATGADALPVWRFLGARLVAEYTLARAAAELSAEAPGAGAAPPGAGAAPPGAGAAPPGVGAAPPGAGAKRFLVAALLLALSATGLIAYLLSAGSPAEESSASSGAERAAAGESDGASSGGAAGGGASSGGATSDERAGGRRAGGGHAGGGHAGGGRAGDQRAGGAGSRAGKAGKHGR